MKFRTLLLFAISSCLIHARLWTDNNGREIDAEIVRADTVIVTLKKGGKEFKFPLSKLTEEDRLFVKEWIENDGDVDEPEEENSPKKNEKPMPVKPSTGSLQFDGKELKAGGEVNLYEYKYSEEDLATLRSKKYKSEDTGYKMGIVVPNDFDPTAPQKVFIASTAINSAEEGRSGNISKIKMYCNTCISNGWLCITYDSNNGRSNNNFDIYRSFEKFNAVWPGFKTWQFATGGFSGGAKACFDPTAFLLEQEYPILGVFMGGCNHDASASGRERYKISKSKYRDLRIFLSTGNQDPLVNNDKLDQVIASLKANGMKNIRSEMFDGVHKLNKEHFELALQWFTTAEK